MSITEQDAIKLFKCLADKSRLQILKSLMIEDMYVERLAKRLDLTAPTISFHLKKLEDAGAVRSFKDQYYTVYSINRAVFETSILKLLTDESTERNEQEAREEAYRKKYWSGKHLCTGNCKHFSGKMQENPEKSRIIAARHLGEQYDISDMVIRSG